MNHDRGRIQSARHFLIPRHRQNYCIFQPLKLSAILIFPFYQAVMRDMSPCPQLCCPLVSLAVASILTPRSPGPPPPPPPPSDPGQMDPSPSSLDQWQSPLSLSSSQSELGPLSLPLSPSGPRTHSCRCSPGPRDPRSSSGRMSTSRWR